MMRGAKRGCPTAVVAYRIRLAFYGAMGQATFGCTTGGRQEQGDETMFENKAKRKHGTKEQRGTSSSSSTRFNNDVALQ